MTAQSSAILAEMEAWYAHSNGQYALEQLRLLLEPALDTAFGYHILQLGLTGDHTLFDSSHINHRVYASESSGKNVGLVASTDELPLESDSIDVLIAHHSLEFEGDPHQALREMHRVLAPQGQLMIIGFNPYSAFGVAALCRGLPKNSPWRNHSPVNTHRITDWLRLLGSEVQRCSYLYSVPPLGRGRLRNAMTRCDAWINTHNVPVGGLYLMHAIKQMPRLNRPRRSLLAGKERLIGLAVPRPTVVPSPTPSIHVAKKPETTH